MRRPAKVFVAIVVVLWLIRRSRTGRAPVSTAGDVLDGVIRCVLVTTVTGSPARHQDDNDQRRVNVLIDLDGPRGARQDRRRPMEFEEKGLRLTAVR